MTPSEFKEARMLCQLTQPETAIRIGRSVRTVIRYEAGQSPIPALVAAWMTEYAEGLRRPALPRRPPGYEPGTLPD